jgi:hypothetical protein
MLVAWKIICIYVYKVRRTFTEKIHYLSVIFIFVVINNLKTLNNQNKELPAYLFVTAHKEFIS